MKVAILGTGLAGLLAAKAAKDCNVEYDLLGKEPPHKPFFPGFTFLHSKCKLPLQKKTIFVQYSGDRKIYGKKKGYSNKTQVSWPKDKSNEFIQGYDPYLAYNLLADMAMDNFYPFNYSPEYLGDLIRGYDLIVSTIPLPVLYPNGRYKYVGNWLKKGIVDSNICENVVIYSGEEHIEWARRSCLWGEVWEEYGKPVEDGIYIQKPIDFHLSFDETINEKILLAGRKGAWSKKELAHQAYFKTFGKIKGLSTAIL